MQFVLLTEEVDALEFRHARERVAAPVTEDRLFDRRWAETLTTSALDRLEEKYASGPKARVFYALKGYLLGSEDAGQPSHEQIAADLGVPVETLRSYLSRMRSRYRELLRAEVIRTVADTADVDDELRYLCEVLVAAS